MSLEEIGNKLNEALSPKQIATWSIGIIFSVMVMAACGWFSWNIWQQSERTHKEYSEKVEAANRYYLTKSEERSDKLVDVVIKNTQAFYEVSKSTAELKDVVKANTDATKELQLSIKHHGPPSNP